MKNLEKYNKIFTDIMEIEPQALTELTYQSIERWDSVGHMQLISELEEAFDIMFDTEDIIDFNSYEKGKELIEKYDINLC